MEYDKLAMIEEKLLDAAYLFGINESKVAMGNAQAEYERNTGSLSGFDRWSIFNVEISGAALIESFSQACGMLTDDEMNVLEAWKHSVMRICEVSEVKENGMGILNDIVSGERVQMQTGGLLKKGEIFIGRTFLLDGTQHISCMLSGVVDRKIAETVKGRLREAYEAYCAINGYVTYENYVGDNPWIVYKIMELIEETGEAEDESVLEVCSAVYIVVDRGFVDGIIEDSHDFILDDEDKGIAYYMFVDEGVLLCEVELEANRIVLNANSMDELGKAQRAMENLFKESIILSETYRENIDELLK